MTAAIRVDGTTYRLLGPLCTPNVSALPTTGLPKVYPTRTVYEFAGAGVEVNMTFASPAFLEDMHSLSLPLALVYFDVRVRSSESGGGGGSHTVELFFEASSQLIVDDDSSPVVWRRDAWASAPGQSAASLAIGTEAQDVLTQRDFYIDPGQPSQHLNWGYQHLTVPRAEMQRATTWMGGSNVARGHFSRNGTLPVVDNLRMPEPVCGASGQFTFGQAVCQCDDGSVDEVATTLPTMAAAFALGHINARHGRQRVRLVLSVDDLGASARFFGQVLGEYWRRPQPSMPEAMGGLSFEDMLQNASNHADKLIAACESYDAATVRELHAVGGLDYAVVASLSYRQTLADNSVLWYPGHMQGKPTRTPASAFLFVKGLGTSGDTGTIGAM
jgi:hypothetical protein